jgi:hypothetical protein
MIPHSTASSYPMRSGNAVRPLVDGVPTFRRIGAAIAAARHSVWLTVAFFAPDFRMPAGGEPLFDVLDRAVDRGLDIGAGTGRDAAGFAALGHRVLAVEPTAALRIGQWGSIPHRGSSGLTTACPSWRPFSGAERASMS